MKPKWLLILSLTILIFDSCSRSVVYSPSLNIPTKILKEKQIDLQGNVELLPESRLTTTNPSAKTTAGMSGQLTYGFSDRLNIGVRAWYDLGDKQGGFRSGYLINGMYNWQIDSSSKLLFIPRAGMALIGDDIKGYGFGAAAIYHRNIRKPLSVYGGLGLLWGFNQLEKMQNSITQEDRMPMGYGVQATLGGSYLITKKLRINVEMNPIYQLNSFDEKNHLLLAPQIGFGYTFR